MEMSHNHHDMHGMNNGHSSMNMDMDMDMDMDMNMDMDMGMGMGDDSQHMLCKDMGMVMYMDGFHWTLKGDHSCLNLFFGSWTLDTIPKFLMAMLLVIGLGVATEGINRWKHSVNHGSQGSSQHLRAGLQALSIASAYLLMLVVMTYSIELLLCVVVGLMIGYYWFDADEIHHGGGTPCCNFLESGETGDNMTQALLSSETTNGNGLSTSNDVEETFESCCNNNENGIEIGNGSLL